MDTQVILHHLLVSQFDMGEHLPLQRLPPLLRTDGAHQQTAEDRMRWA